MTGRSFSRSALPVLAVIAAVVFTLWLAVSIGYFLWHTIRYTGIMGQLGEREFMQISIYYPTLTYMILVLLSLLPLLLLILAIRLIFYRKRIALAGERIVASNARLAALFSALSLFGLVGAVVTLGMMFQHPTDGPTHTIDVGKNATPVEGPAVITGVIDYARAARLKDEILVAHREIYIAPIVARGGQEETLRYFVEVPSPGTNGAPVPSKATGVLAARALPREIAQLYANSGSNVAVNNYMLFSSGDSLRWRYWAVAAQFAIFGLISLLFAVLQFRHNQKLKSELEAIPAAG
ncbi:hypothetical protein [Sphingomonas sp.]|uniref:hypothetical protein n=1 Tax=Sphingomonas sp. TaxID=28214 RepID=UPI001B029186|nr:hypothetical protein [Sphingomonas sp.]MBO9714526.1 hypothetical protein [Sphingomonas sp.]